MIKKILNIGIHPSNSESLNRRIRVSNLISFITIITMIGYIPAAIAFQMTGIIVLNIGFLISSSFGFYLHSKHHYNAAIYITCTFGLIYFIFGTIFYGLQSNLHFFMLIMCLISIALFESALTLKVFLATAVISFFAMLIGLKGIEGFLTYTDEMRKAQDVISVINLFILFVVTILFFVFFRRENLLFQKDILKQKDIIEEKQKEILDSIAYAKRIQFSLLASDNLLTSNLHDYFVLFKPKDVVSGDFYWATPTPEGFIYVTADCTGHGVPGAFMSLLNISKLSQVINENKITRPDSVLNNVRTEIIKVLNAEGTEESKDGMDAILCKIDLNAMKLQYAAANNSFYIVRDKQLLACKADKMPVGKGHDDSISFTFNEIELKKGDVVYTFTDGYADQFGGPKGKKFRYKQLEDILISICELPTKEQADILGQKFEDWKGSLDQVDDVLIMGVKI
ncbi:MAG: SpoIIE family protein phosphatase [Bacteroidota bacterium]